MKQLENYTKKELIELIRKKETYILDLENAIDYVAHKMWKDNNWNICNETLLAPRLERIFKEYCDDDFNLKKGKKKDYNHECVELIKEYLIDELNYYGWGY